MTAIHSPTVARTGVDMGMNTDHQMRISLAPSRIAASRTPCPIPRKKVEMTIMLYTE